MCRNRIRILSAPIALLLLISVVASGLSPLSPYLEDDKRRVVEISTGALLPDNPRAHYSRFVNVRPGQGETVYLNPPRFSWFYCPQAEEKLQRGEVSSCNHIFTLQISAAPDFKKLAVEVTTP